MLGGYVGKKDKREGVMYFPRDQDEVRISWKDWKQMGKTDTGKDK